MSFNPNDLSEEMRLAGEDKADKDAAAKIYTETRKHFRAKLAMETGCTSTNRAELLAEASEEYRDYILKGIELTKIASKAATYYECIKYRIELIRSLEATNRAQMKL